MIPKVQNPKQTSWKIVYNEYVGMQKNAVDFLSTEVGRLLLRDEGVYTTYVLPCEKYGCETDKNAIFVGKYDDNATIRQFVKADEIPDGGYCVKVVRKPDDQECVYVLITARDDTQLYYGATAFVDEYPVACAPTHGGLRLPDEIFDQKMPEWTTRSRPRTVNRGVFTWAHPINDYRKYIENLARLRLNRLVLWNDYLPLNAKEAVEYARQFGIQVFWGYSWGWKSGLKVEGGITDEYLKKLKEAVIEEYETFYRDLDCDGIYFQSFTETSLSYVGDKTIAQLVTEFVNDTAEELLKRYPHLQLEFGLHATSVKDHLHEIAKVDPRVEIVWEDCGTFPFNYTPVVRDEKAFEATVEFAKKIVGLRPGAPVGLYFKGLMTLDWERFAYQNGPYVLGKNVPQIGEHDFRVRRSIWKMFQAQWMQYGAYAQRLIKEITELGGGMVNLSIAGMLDGGIWLPEALYAAMFWDPDGEYGELLCKTAAKPCITLA